MPENEADNNQCSGTECPTCGRDDFKNWRGVKQHHARTHGESIGGVIVECDWCGDDFRMPRARELAHELHFCDKECKGNWQSKNWVNENNPNCDTRTRRECIICGDEFYLTPAQVENRRGEFCSYDCMGVWASKHRRGENAANWQGGISGKFDYGVGWHDSKREKVRERDDECCRACGMSSEEHIEKHGRDLDVHHIQKARLFDDPRERNAMSNLITLCHSCHMKWERMFPLIPLTDD